MKITIVGLILVLSTVQAGVFTENRELWAEIDRVNNTLETESLDSDALEALFQETVQLALSFELQSQFEDLRTDAYEINDFTLIDEYAERAATAINVLIMGESNNIGVNITSFLIASAPNTEAYSFFTLAIGGFYTDINDWIAIAEFPEWRIRTHSSFQGRTDKEKAEEWLGHWKILKPSLDGYFLVIADATIDKLTILLNE